MKIRSVVLSFAVSGLLATMPIVAQAQNQDSFGYFGASLGMVNIPEADDDILAGTDTSLFAGLIYGGAWFTENIGAEIGFMKSAKGDIKINNRSTGADYDANTLYGAIIGRMTTESNFNPFVKVGYHRWELNASAQSDGTIVTISDDGSDFLLGIGADTEVADSWNVRAEYTYLSYEDNGKVHGFFSGRQPGFLTDSVSRPGSLF